MKEFRDYNDSQLEIERLKRICPAAFSSQANSSVSQKYSFISTENIINILSKNKFFVHSASQTRSRIEEKALTTKHILKFRHESARAKFYNVGGLIPEIILNTSHDGLSSFKFMGGIFRLVCENGLVIADAFCSNYNIRHMGANETDIIDAVFDVLESTNQGVERTIKMKELELSKDQKEQFAHEAFFLRWSESECPDFSPVRLLEAKRSADRSNDLFTVFNVVQENIIKGGIRFSSKNDDGIFERNKVRAITSIDANIKINKGLWSLAEKYLNSAT